MKNKTLITVIYLTFVSMTVGLIGLIIGNNKFEIFINIGGGFFLITGVYLLAKNGEFIKTREFKLNGLGIALIIIGVMFKIMHWPLSGIILGIGYLCIIVLYLIYLIRKDNINWSNWLKLSFIVIFFTGRYFQAMHWPYNEELSILSILFLGILIIKFIKDNKPKLKAN